MKLHTQRTCQSSRQGEGAIFNRATEIDYLWQQHEVSLQQTGHILDQLHEPGLYDKDRQSLLCTLLMSARYGLKILRRLEKLGAIPIPDIRAAMSTAKNTAANGENSVGHLDDLP